MSLTTSKIPACPHCCPLPRGRPARVRSAGVFRRASSGRILRRYFCNDCDRGFSDATLTFEYRQRRRDLNFPLFKALASNVSMRRVAIIHNTNRKTVERRLAYFDRVARHQQKILLDGLPKSDHVQFDDMETSENTKLKPLSISTTVRLISE